MNGISTFRLYLLRALYLLIFVGLVINIWPGFIARNQQWELMEGVVVCMLVAFSLMAALGVRYPLQMLPILLWELVWKVIWLTVVALPKWQNGQIDEATAANTFACLFVVLVVIAVPWRYVFEHYVKKAGDPWFPRAARPQLAPSTNAISSTKA